MDGWNTIVSFWGAPLFSGAFAVSFREGKFSKPGILHLQGLVTAMDPWEDVFWILGFWVGTFHKIIGPHQPALI